MKQGSVVIGVLGCGWRSQQIVRDLLKMAESDKIEIAQIWDPDPASVKAFCEKFVVKSIAVSAEALIENPAIEWILIGSWNCYHAEQAVASLKAGKHVFCEKPLATSLEDCLAIRDAVESTGNKFVLGLVLRYSPHYQYLSTLLRSGGIGQIISFEFNEILNFNHGGYIFGNWRRRRQHAGTHMLEKCCHDLDLANWMVGSLPLSVASFGGRSFFIEENAYHLERLGKSPEGVAAYCTWPDRNRVNPFSPGSDIMDHQVAVIEYANGVKATFHTNCNAALPERRFFICGTEGTIRADMVQSRIEVCRIGFDEEPRTLESGHHNGHAGGDLVMARGLYETMVNDAETQASIFEGICSAVSAFGIDDAMDQKCLIDLQPSWKRSGIDPFLPLNYRSQMEVLPLAEEACAASSPL